MTLAYHIVDWESHYEVDDNKRPWEPGKKFRPRPIEYIRCSAWGLIWGEGWRKLLAGAGAEADQVFGLFIKLLEVAACRGGGQRGWVLSSGHETLGPRRLAEKLGFDPARVQKSLSILIYKVGWLEIADCAFAQDGGEPVTFGQEITVSQIPGKIVEPSERNRTEGEEKDKPKSLPARANLALDADGSGSRPEMKAGRLEKEEEEIAGLPAVGPGDRDSEFGDRHSENIGEDRKIGNRTSAGADGGQGARGPFSNLPSGQGAGALSLKKTTAGQEEGEEWVFGNELGEPGAGAQRQVGLARAAEAVEQAFPSMTRETAQGRGDRTTVWHLLERAYEAQGQKGLDRLVTLAQEKARCKTLDKPIAVWTKKAGQLYPPQAAGSARGP